jgi:hypothetical protein
MSNSNIFPGIASPRRAWIALTSAVLAAACAGPAREAEPQAAGAVPTATTAERIARWTRERPGQPLPASIGFRAVQPESAIVSLLERHGVRPYVAHAWGGTVAAYAQVPPDQADVAVLAESRRLLLERLERNLCGVADRIRSLRQDQAATGRPARDQERAERVLLGRLRTEREALAQVRGGSPVIWGVYVVGPVEAVARLGSDPMVAAFEPVATHVEEGQVIVGVPRPPEPPPVGQLPAYPDVSSMPMAQVRAALDALAAEPAAPCPTGRSGSHLSPGNWVVVARRGGRAVLAAHPAARGAAERRPERGAPTSLDVLIHAPGEPAQSAAAELVLLTLPGVPADQARPLRIGRVRLAGRDVYFTAPGWSPSLIPSPTDPNLYLFGEGNALWTFTPGRDVRRLTAERVAEFDRAALAARQREGEVILYWATDPVWSPDGRTIAYVTNREAVAQGGSGQAVWLLEPGTGRERPLLSVPDESFSAFGWLGRELLYTGPPGVGAVDPATGTRRQLAFGLDVAAAADGSAVAIADDVPHATRIQVLSTTGAATVPAAPPGSSYAAQAVFSPGGTRLLLLATTADGHGRRYYVFHRDTARLTPVSSPAEPPGDWPSWLDDDTLLLPTVDPGTRQVNSWIVDVGGTPGG